MRYKKAQDKDRAEVTPKSLYMDRREFIAGTSAVAAASFLGFRQSESQDVPTSVKLQIAKKGEYTVDETWTSVDEATGYVNYYEFSTSKRAPKELSRNFKTRPWQVAVEGLVEKPLRFDIEDLISRFPLEERIYRWRCVEAWSMVIPWIGFPLKDLVTLCKPTSKAKFVEFTTAMDRQQMPGLTNKVLPWPYTEGLRMDEAVHPLTLMAVGMYGEALPNQNGAPLRLVVPWKYGFKGAKSIVRIRFTEKMPRSAWNRTKSEEYGFYANVNPQVDHPRWTQASERRIGEPGRRPTLMFNGYGEQVAYLYEGMDLKKLY